MRVLMSGASGFIGRSLIRYLNTKYFIVGLDEKNLSLAVKQDNFIFNRLDVMELVSKRFDFDLDVFVHLAAYIDVEESFREPLKYIYNNVYGTASALEFSRVNDIGRFVYISSAAVYGDPRYLPIDENHETRPISVYGSSKLLGEEIVKMYSEIYGIEYVILRLFNVYGPGQNPQYAGVITRFIENVLGGRPPVIYGDGLQTRDFIHVSDVCEAIKLAIEKDVVGTFNIGSGTQTRIVDLANLIIELTGKKLEPVFTSPREGDIRHSYADIKKAREELGFEPKIDLESGIEDLIRNWERYKREFGVK